MKRTLIIAIFSLIIGIGIGGFLLRSPHTGPGNAGGRKILYYVDPMHPAYTSDKPGIAPDCGMKLEPVYADGGSESDTGESKGKILYYRDPQHPDFKSDKPGLNPETGKELEPVYENNPSTFPVGTVQISPEKQQLIGVKYGIVEQSSASETIRTVGTVTYDETRIANVHTKFEGWVDTVYVNFTGAPVKKGQPLFTIYSPELLATQEEMLLIARGRNLMKKSSLPGAADQNEALLRAARQRLELWDLNDNQINEILNTGKAIKNITVYSPISGYVLERKVFPKVKITSETDLFIVADLSKIWIMANVFEYEIPNIHLGQPARITLSYYPEKQFAARVIYIQPQVDPMTRTIKVRLQLDNPGLLLKPDMYVNVDFAVNRRILMTVPVDAVLDAGEKKTVFVDRGNGYFEPRRIEIGEQVGDRIAVLSGLTAGERIVTSGNFLIDSESQLKAAAAGMGGMAGHQHGSKGMDSMPEQKPATGDEKGQTPAPAKGEGAHKHD